MIFWLAVLVGGLFAWIAVQIGFYASWIMFFNLLLSAYIAIFLTPVIMPMIPEAFGYEYGLVLMTVAIATLLIAYGMCFACLSGQLRAEFPKAFDNIGAGLLGFLTGFLVCSFVAFAVALTPAAHIDSLKPLGLDSPLQKTTPSTKYLCGWCNTLHSLVASSGADSRLRTSQGAVDWLAAKTGAPAGGRRPGIPRGPAEGQPPPPGPNPSANPDAEETPAMSKEGPEAGKEPEPEARPRAGSAAETAKPAVPSGPPRRLGKAMEEEPALRGEKTPASGGKSTPAPPATPEGPLSGTWQAIGKARFRVDDDGKTLAIELLSGGPIQALTGKLTRVRENPDSKILTGTFDAVFAIEPATHNVVDVVMTIADADHLNIRCENWPKWNNRGKSLGKGLLKEQWTRVEDSPATSVRDPFAP